MPKKIVITGVNGQLGQHLAKYFTEELNLSVIGTIRHKSYDDQEYIFDKNKVKFELMDLSDPVSIDNIISNYKPDYFINTAANAFVGESWSVPAQHLEINALGVLYQLESIKKHSSITRYISSGSSEEMAVSEKTGPQNENTIINPKSPYGVSKAAARYLVNVYRKSYNLYAIQNWTFNFESAIRGEKYVTRKITKWIGDNYSFILHNRRIIPLQLGNIYSSRSWQHASDVAIALWKTLNQDKYDTVYAKTGDAKDLKEYVISSSTTHTVKEFVTLAFKYAGINGSWEGEGLNEKYIYNGQILVEINKKFYRPLDVTFLYGDASLIKKELDWKPKISFEDLVREMVLSDMKVSLAT